MIRSTYSVRDTDGSVITLNTYENDSRVYLDTYADDGEGLAQNHASENALTATVARQLAAMLLKAADKADTA